MAQLTECPVCHGKVSDQAPACPHCGQPMQAIEEPAQWETCEVALEADGLSMFKGKGMLTHMFWSRAIGPNGEYSPAQSSRFGLNPLYPTGGGTLNPIPHPQDGNARAALRELIQKLTADGWEPSETRGGGWYSERFRRRVKPPPYVGDVFAPDEPIKLVGGDASPDPNVVIDVPAGTACTILGISENWLKLKTESGDVGFVTGDSHPSLAPPKPQPAGEQQTAGQTRATGGGTGCLVVLALPMTLLPPAAGQLCALLRRYHRGNH
jgi:hypothetical protein